MVGAALAAGLSGCATHRPPVGYVPPPGTTAVGVASWYGSRFHGRRTSNGERFDENGFTAAHRLWAFGTQVRVTYLRTGRSVVVRVNDRLPRKDRLIDLSRAAARAIGLIGPGTGKVRLEVVGREARADKPLRNRAHAVPLEGQRPSTHGHQDVPRWISRAGSSAGTGRSSCDPRWKC
jgi:rare lipoprotein A (peptidoglycan hydrolase)